MQYAKAKEKIKDILQNDNENSLQDVVDFLQANFKNYTWIGIYIVKNKMLHLGPWQGDQSTEHTRIPIGEGICGSAVQSGNTENIADVKADDRYLSCFLSTRSEIVVPIKKNNDIIGEIDIDSDEINAFSKDDEVFLKEIADMLSSHIRKT